MSAWLGRSGLPQPALWGPVPAYAEGRWRLFYVAYRSRADALNYDGEVWEATSAVAGPAGVTGPYVDRAVVLSEEAGRQPWEGAQGDDSFMPYQLPDGSWRAFYGSSDDKSIWRVGLASAPTIDGPWTRLGGNPSSVSRTIENPIVVATPGGYVAVFDDVSQNHAVGVMHSRDGVTWGATTDLPVAAGGVRTPVGLVNGTLFYTACRRQVCDPYSDRPFASR